ncbi:MAG: hypothetical protein C4555_07820 [Dehalococcoidia bacterium]|nr:MAG: hypothetical protein C4555_07820 [Dehalococcoidia bacterium]
MVNNKKQVKPKREMSRQQLSNWQKQQRRQRLVLNIAIGVVVAVFLIIGIGWFVSDYQPRHQKVLVINGNEFRMDYYLAALKYYSGSDAASVGQIEPQLVSYIQEVLLTREGAEALGLSVTADETDAALKTLGVSDEYRDFVEVELLAQKVFDSFRSEVPAQAEYRHLNALFVESESKAQEVLASLEASDNFTALAPLVSEDSYTRQQSGDLGFQMKETLELSSYLGSSVVADYAFSMPADNITVAIVHDDTKAKRLGYWLIKVTDRETQMTEIQTDDNQTGDNQTVEEETADTQTVTVSRVRISAILLGSRDEADMVKARLDGGEDFAALAGELSRDSTSREQGGELGWFSPDTIRPAFELFALNPTVPMDVVSDVIRDTATVTNGGYWLVKVIESEEREVAAGDRDLLAQEAYSGWYTALRTNPENKIDILLTEKQRAWAVATARRELSR